MNKKIEEATPKSTKERILRRTRRKIGTVKHRSMVGRVVPKKTANNDPSRGGNRIHNKPLPDEIKESILWWAKNTDKRGRDLYEALSKLDDKHIDALGKLVEHMIVTSLGGWFKRDDSFVNLTGHTASLDNWVLEGDKLRPITESKDYVNPCLDWLLEVREYCDARPTNSRR